MKRLESFIFFLSLLCLTITVPLSITIYDTSWYYFNYELQETEEKVGEGPTEYTTKGILDYYLYRGDLPITLSAKEMKHFEEVRNYLGVLYIITILSFVGVFRYWRRHHLSAYAGINIVALLLSTAIFTNFRYFWDEIFHPILFNNPFWINYPYEISYYLFKPEIFFFNSLIFIIAISLFLNILIFIYALIHYRIEKKEREQIIQ